MSAPSTGAMAKSVLRHRDGGFGFYGYTYARQDDAFKFGVNIYFDAPTPPAMPTGKIITK